jgi:hypothetical protein
MKRLLAVMLACSLPLAFLACGEASRHPKTPTVVVQELFVRVGTFKDAQKAAKENESSEEAAKALADSKQAVGALFLNPQKAKLLTMPLVFLDLEDVDFLEEKIDGDNAEVTIEHTVVGVGQLVELQESAQKRRKMTFQLKKENGRWLISDTGGILQKFGR